MQTAISQAKQPPPQLKIYCGMREGKEGIAVVDTELVVREVLGLTPLIQRNVLRPMERCGSRMGPNQLVILRLLREHGPLTMAQLGRALSVCRQQMTCHIDDLLRKGLVTRAQGEKDRRTVLIALTDRGLEALERQEREAMRALYPIFDGYSQAQKAGLLETARTMREIMHG